jgi:hypothetical protein
MRGLTSTAVVADGGMPNAGRTKCGEHGHAKRGRYARPSFAEAGR